MKEQGRHIDIDELFRQKLETAELIPGPDTRINLMRRVARKEFFHFNPARLNIWYAAAAVATGVAAALLLLSSSPPESSVNPDEPAFNTDIVTEIQQPSPVKIEDQKADKKGINIRKPGKSPSEVERDIKKDESGLKNKPVEEYAATVKTDTLVKAGAISEIVPGNSGEPALRKRLWAAFGISGYSGCAPFKVKFINSSSNATSFHWSFGDGGSSTGNEPEWIYDQEGEYTVTLRATGPEGEEMTVTSQVIVYGRPSARFEIYPEKPIIPDDAVRFLNYSKDAVKFHWDFGDGKSSDQFEPEHRYLKSGRWDVRLIALSEHGCSDTVTMLDAFAGSGSYIEFPNAFIPNTDGPSGGYYSNKSDETAQIFHPVTSGVSEYQLRVFSKRGVMIFESNDVNIGWDGYHKGQLCEPGVYVWKVRGTFRNGESFVRMGDLTLLKR